jgi:hypothetical protein
MLRLDGLGRFGSSDRVRSGDAGKRLAVRGCAAFAEARLVKLFTIYADRACGLSMPRFVLATSPSRAVGSGAVGLRNGLGVIARV